MSAVLTEIYKRVGTQLGMPVFEVSGLCTSPAPSSLTAKETGRVQMYPIPRRKGIAVKALDNTAIPALSTLNDVAIGGSYSNCLQVGRTTFERYAPEQPTGFDGAGKEILMYRQVFIQLEE